MVRLVVQLAGGQIVGQVVRQAQAKSFADKRELTSVSELELVGGPVWTKHEARKPQELPV